MNEKLFVLFLVEIFLFFAGKNFFQLFSSLNETERKARLFLFSPNLSRLQRNQRTTINQKVTTILRTFGSTRSSSAIGRQRFFSNGNNTAFRACKTDCFSL